MSDMQDQGARTDEGDVNLTRREVVASLTGACLLPGLQCPGADSDDVRITDTNVSLFRWPFRRLPLDTTDRLVRRLTDLGVHDAWAGTFEGLLHRDLDAANARLTEECRKHSLLTPVGSVNPTLPGWEADLARCADVFGMSIIRLHPGYHGYTLADPSCRGLLARASRLKLIVQIAVAAEDVRTQPSAMRTPDVDVGPLLPLLQKQPEARVQILNARSPARIVPGIRSTPRLFFDTARVDGTDAVAELVTAARPGSVLFGSHAPFLIPEAALIRVHESGRLNHAGLLAVYSGNADRLITEQRR